MFSLFKFVFFPLFIVKRLLWRTIWHSVYYFLKKPVRFIYLGGAILILLSMLATEKDPTYYPPLEPPKPVQEKKEQVVTELPPIKGKIKNGNSVFNRTVLAVMSEQERQLYSTHFINAMNNVRGGEPYKWQVSENYFGKVTPDITFKARSGVYCRRFNELISYRGAHEKFNGIACQRKSGGWCRLNPDSAHSCEIGYPSQWDLFWNNLF